ncbi:ABC transporter permease [Demequina litorisediminis]|uniref:Nitrate ABC transporter permease n=1 Tax=Demequina litorisediminis TaxID=1849022 RepID=A0ABQ6ICW6_9MICO|nr:ABC transporter permease subunit [Demequina litorisediminis]GMA34578.1 nitrate ABC transporter permease [Demequina litorisediminis]
MSDTIPSTATDARQVTDLSDHVRAESRRAARRALVSSLGTFVGALAAVLVIWQGAIMVFDLSPYVAKGPVDVWRYFTSDVDAADNRAEVAANLGVTMADALIGFVAGLTLAVLIAILFQLSKGLEAALMPVALLLRTVPLIAFAPVVIMIFGRGFLTTAVMGGIVVLFPALVNIAFGLKGASPQMLDVVTVYGGGAVTRLRKVAMPGSLPAFFAAVRISVPGAITGALLAEWLATGGGIGGVINGYFAQAKFTDMWASVVAVTAVSLVLYNVVAIIENTVLARMGMHPSRRF